MSVCLALFTVFSSFFSSLHSFGLHFKCLRCGWLKLSSFSAAETALALALADASAAAVFFSFFAHSFADNFVSHLWTNNGTMLLLLLFNHHKHRTIKRYVCVCAINWHNEEMATLATNNQQPLLLLDFFLVCSSSNINRNSSTRRKKIHAKRLNKSPRQRQEETVRQCKCKHKGVLIMMNTNSCVQMIIHGDSYSWYTTTYSIQFNSIRFDSMGSDYLRSFSLRSPSHLPIPPVF